MKLKKDLGPTKIQQMSKKPNRNPTNETKTQQKSNNSSEKPNKKPNILLDLLDFSWVFFVGLPTPDFGGLRWN